MQVAFSVRNLHRFHCSIRPVAVLVLGRNTQKVDGDFLDRLGLMVTELNDMKAMARMRGIVEKK